MTPLHNATLERLEAGELALGIGLRQARSVDVGRIMKTCGFDWLFIDTEHNSMSVDTAVQISVAAGDAGITPIVRVPGFEHHHATRVLDGGAQGVVIPHVDTAEQAAQVVADCKYAPLGHRSVTSALPQIDFEAMPIGEAAAAINAATMVVVMVETPKALENVEAIAAVPGINVVLIGTSDLTMEMGIPGQTGDQRVTAAYERVIAACQKNGVHVGMGGISDLDHMARYITMGACFVLAGSDIALMMKAAKEQSARVRALLPG
jgi:2-keto-3-deoxy-L-rhamnonate aldolase RhmA